MSSVPYGALKGAVRKAERVYVEFGDTYIHVTKVDLLSVLQEVPESSLVAHHRGACLFIHYSPQP